jgi:hypothetical protein
MLGRCPTSRRLVEAVCTARLAVPLSGSPSAENTRQAQPVEKGAGVPFLSPDEHTPVIELSAEILAYVRLSAILMPL